ncbi:MAG: hypothetical protein MJ193_05230 [Clostridia bacterium]|nr:hypothetical protein [Clostridia bacterium]
MIVLFFIRGEVDSDKFIKYGYSQFRDFTTLDLPDKVSIVRNENEKPHLDIDTVFFNLSHSHGVCLLGFADNEIGVDIEKIRDIDFKKFDFIKAQDEYEFFEKWTERESYLKFTGKGLSNGFRCEIPENAHFEHFDVFGEYHACVCAKEQNIRAFEISPTALD